MNERNPYESDDTVDIPDFSSIKVNDDDIDRSVFKMNDDIPSYNESEYDDEEDYYEDEDEDEFEDDDLDDIEEPENFDDIDEEGADI